jgi:hypothetical protein
MKKVNSNKIGGWLVFFLVVFVLMTVATAFHIVSFIIDGFFTEQIGNYIGLDVYPPVPNTAFTSLLIFLSSALLVLLVMTITGILRRKRWAKNLSVFSAWFGAFTSLILGVVGITMIPNWVEYYALILQEEFVYSSYYLGIAKGILTSVIWAVIITCYFLRSKRVSETLVNS